LIEPLNSLWGKFGQLTCYIARVQIIDMKTSDQQEVKNVRFMNEEVVQLDITYETENKTECLKNVQNDMIEKFDFIEAFL
jgi:hypothetical protein